jgi:hypothetical protein
MTSLSALLVLQLNSDGSTGGLFGSVFGLVSLAIVVVVIVAGWKVFAKAGQPGWAILIPIYNTYIFIKIAGRPGWWLLLMFIPLVNIVIAAIVAMDVAKAFGQSAAWGFVLLFLLLGIGYLILGFGNARYVGPVAGSLTRVPATT